MDPSSERLGAPAARWGPPAIVALLTLAAFSPVLSNQFVDWDDGANFLTNTSYRGLGWTQLAWMATTFHRGVYQPLAWLFAAVEYQIGGVQPWVFHAGSWLLHAAAAVLVYAVARRIFPRLAPDRPVAVAFAATAAALLWAVHPLRVEAVAWASAQGYPLAAALALGAVLAWLHAREPGAAPVWFAGSLTLAIGAYLAKPVAVTLPAALIILDWYLTPRGAWWPSRRIWLAAAYLVPAVLVAAVAPMARAALGSSASAHIPLVERLAQACYGAMYYAVKTLVPAGLTVFTPLPRPIDPAEPRFAAAAIGVVVLGLFVGWTARRIKGPTAAALAYLALLTPVLGVLRQGDQLVADRYGYFAGIPLSLGIAGGLLLVAARVAPRIGPGLAALALAAMVGLSVASWGLVHVWRDAGTLWTRAVAVDPASYQAHTNFGLFELGQGRYEAAVRAFDRAIAINPASSNARFNRGLAQAKWGRTDEAIAAYQAGLALDPADPTARAHLGDVFAAASRWPDAEREYRIALRLAPHPDLFNSLGIVLAQQGRFAEAVAAFREALARNPGHADARANLEMALSIEPDRP